MRAGAKAPKNVERAEDGMAEAVPFPKTQKLCSQV